MRVLIKTIPAMLLLMLAAAPYAPHASENSFVGNAQAPAKQQKAPRKVDRYACPMHPEVSSTRRRKCPKCGMTLRLVKQESDAAPAPIPAPQPASASDEIASLSSARIPDVEVLDQNGKRLKFNSDLIKGKTVAINFIFTTCTAICPPLTATFRRLQKEIIAQNLSVQLISISVDPTTDTPERLRDFAAKFKAEPGWTFVTGDKAAIESILQALGTAVAVKTDHTPMILIGNDVSGYWTRAYGLSPPSVLIKVISEAAEKK